MRYYLEETTRFFNEFRFKLDIQANLKITNYLNVTFNLYDGTESSFRKNDHDSCYLNEVLITLRRSLNKSLIAL